MSLPCTIAGRACADLVDGLNWPRSLRARHRRLEAASVAEHMSAASGGRAVGRFSIARSGPPWVPWLVPMCATAAVAAAVLAPLALHFLFINQIVSPSRLDA